MPAQRKSASARLPASQVGVVGADGTAAAMTADFSIEYAGHLTGDGDPKAALVDLEEGLRVLPAEENLRFLRVGALLAEGDVEGGRSELRSLLAERPTWEVVVRSFAAKGLITVPGDVSVDALLG